MDGNKEVIGSAGKELVLKTRGTLWIQIGESTYPIDVNKLIQLLNG